MCLTNWGCVALQFSRTSTRRLVNKARATIFSPSMPEEPLSTEPELCQADFRPVQEAGELMPRGPNPVGSCSGRLAKNHRLITIMATAATMTKLVKIFISFSSLRNFPRWPILCLSFAGRVQLPAAGRSETSIKTAERL